MANLPKFPKLLKSNKLTMLKYFKKKKKSNKFKRINILKKKKNIIKSISKKKIDQISMYANEKLTSLKPQNVCKSLKNNNKKKMYQILILIKKNKLTTAKRCLHLCNQRSNPKRKSEKPKRKNYRTVSS